MSYRTREQSAEYHLKRYHKIKTKMISHLGGICVVCSVSKNLDIHHVDPENKSFDISKNWGRPWEDIKTELSKCELRCKEHHIEIHEAKHGTISRYRGWRCRCYECKKVWNDYCRPFWQEYKRKKKLEKLNSQFD